MQGGELKHLRRTVWSILISSPFAPPSTSSPPIRPSCYIDKTRKVCFPESESSPAPGAWWVAQSRLGAIKSFEADSAALPESPPPSPTTEREPCRRRETRTPRRLREEMTLDQEGTSEDEESRLWVRFTALSASPR